MMDPEAHGEKPEPEHLETPAGSENPAGHEHPEPVWVHVHRATPLVKGWIILAVTIFAFGRSWVENRFTPDEGKDAAPNPQSWLTSDIGLLILLGVVVLAVIYAWIAWRFMGYRITSTHVQVRSGVFERRHRQARIDRIQSIDVTRPFLARIFGLAELTFYVADAQGAAAKLAYIKHREAERLRAQILDAARTAQQEETHPTQEEAQPDPHLSAAAGPAEEAEPGASPATASEELTEPADPGIAPATGASQTDPADTLVARVPTVRLLFATVVQHLGWLTPLIVAWVVALLIAGADNATVWVIFIPYGLAVGSLLFTDINRNAGFTASTGPNGLILKRGLTDSTRTTIPPQRIHALGMKQPLLWKLFGWWRVSGNMPSEEESGQQQQVLLPVAKFHDAVAVMEAMIPDPGTQRIMPLMVAAADSPSREPEFLVTPRRAWWISPIARSRQACAITRTMVIVTTGRMTKQVALIPHARTQGVALRQGPLGRAAGVAAVAIGTVSGPVDTQIEDMDMEAAQAFLAEQNGRAAAAARTSDSNHWEGPG